MEEMQNSGRPYNKLISQEETTEDEPHLPSNQENQGMKNQRESIADTWTLSFLCYRE